MPACARKEIIRQGEPGIFHCWNRCVRRAFLLGKDEVTGKDYSERRRWITDRLQLLVMSFTIDVGFFATLGNHLHVVLRTNPRLAKNFGSQEVARRWLRVFPGKHVLDGNWIEPTDEQVEELAENKDLIRKYRKRLGDISWFMRALSENIARRANHWEKVSGRFWSGRFSCREVTNEASLLICGMYVDLNQVRACEAATPEDSLQCSVAWRIQNQLAQRDIPNDVRENAIEWLAPLTMKNDDIGEVPSASGKRASDKGLLAMSLDQYVQLLDFVGREIREDKRGAIPGHLAPILERLQIRQEELTDTVKQFPKLFRRLAGQASVMYQRAKEVGRQWFHGVRAAANVFVEPSKSD